MAYVSKDADGRLAMELEPDQRHVDVLLTELLLTGDKVKGAATPRVKGSKDQVVNGRDSPLLDPEGARIFRSGTMHLTYLGQDRGDIQEATQCLAQNMQDRASTIWENFAESRGA